MRDHGGTREQSHWRNRRSRSSRNGLQGARQDREQQNAAKSTDERHHCHLSDASRQTNKPDQTRREQAKRSEGDAAVSRNHHSGSDQQTQAVTREPAEIATLHVSRNPLLQR